MEQLNLSISSMSEYNLEKIKNILEIEFDNFWNYSIFKSELQNSNSKYFIIKDNNEIIGFIGILIVLDVADITNIVIKKAYRSKRTF